MEQLLSAAGEIRGVELALVTDPKRSEIPVVTAQIDADVCGMSALDVIRRLHGDPSIQANPTHVREGGVAFGPMCLKEGEPEIVGRRLREVLSA